MKIISTLSAVLLSACTVPGLQMGSTLSASAPSGSSPAPVTAPAPAPTPTPAPAPAQAPPPAPAMPSATAAPAPRDLTYRDVDPIDGAAKLLGYIASGEVAPGHATRESELRNQARWCSQQVANLIAHDYRPTTVLPLEHGKATLGEADATICQALAKAADGWAGREDQVHAAENDALLEPYKKAGVAGDKLKLVDGLGKQLIGPGQAEASPAVVAHASVLFSLRHDGPHEWTIVRYAFKGNQKVGETEKGYVVRPGPDQYR